MKKICMVRLALAGLIVSAAGVAALVNALSPAPKAPAFEATHVRGGYTLVLDPGHGGADGGAVSVSGAYESGINLEIALRARQIAGFFGVDPVMTRESEELNYPDDAVTIRAKKVWDTKRRAELANSLEDAFFISIHQNKFTSADTPGSADAAQILQSKLLAVAPGNRQNATKIPDTVYIMNHISCPAVLIECGFVSNIPEAKKLEDPSYQTKLAAVIVGGYLESVS